MTASPSAVALVAAGPRHGMGHLARSTALLAALGDAGLAISVIVDGPDESVAIAAARGFTAARAAGTIREIAETIRARTPALLIADSYDLDAADFAVLRGAASRLVVIDDEARRRLAVDVVINAGAGSERLHYPDAGLVLAGASFALLQPPYAALAPRPFTAGPVRRILVTAGGGDTAELAARMCAAVLDGAPAGCAIDAVVGPFAAEHFAGDARVTVHQNPRNLIDLQRTADLAVSAAGQTMYELCACGTPSIVVTTAENQRRGAESMAESGAVVYAGEWNSGAGAGLSALVTALASDSTRRERLAQVARRLIDGQGARRAAEHLVRAH